MIMSDCLNAGPIYLKLANKFQYNTATFKYFVNLPNAKINGAFVWATTLWMFATVVYIPVCLQKLFYKIKNKIILLIFYGHELSLTDVAGHVWKKGKNRKQQ